MDKSSQGEDQLSSLRHKIKNDLTVIRLNLSLIDSKPQNRETYIAKIDERIEMIIKELKEFKITP